MDLKVIPNIKFLDSNNFFLIAGPCAIESEEMALQIAQKINKIRFLTNGRSVNSAI